MQRRIPAVYMRGGTSKGVYFHENHLPKEQNKRDQLILSVFGSPDLNKRQIDGMGGAVSTTSKVVIISPSDSPDHHIDYLFGQVSIDKPLIDYKGNCGNLSSGVGPFAIDEGLVKAQAPITKIKIFQVNTQKTIIADVPVKFGKHDEEGDFTIDGVPGSGGKITLHFLDPGGSKTGALLPTGQEVDYINIQSVGDIKVSIVDAANPLVFVRAEDLKLSGTEIYEIDNTPRIKKILENIRSQSAVILGFAHNVEEATKISQAIPKIAFVSKPQSYTATTGKKIQKESIDITTRIMSMGTLHKAYAVTGAICTAGAAKIEGTIVNKMVVNVNAKSSIKLGHPGGMITIGTRIEKNGNDYIYKEALVDRTARRLMEGYVLIPDAKYWSP